MLGRGDKVRFRMVVITHSRHKSQRRGEEDPTANASQHALGEHELPIVLGNAHEEHSEYLQDGANEQCGDEETGIKEAPTEDAANHCKPDLQRPDP